MKQIPLGFSARPALGREDFLVAPANEQAVAWIDRWPDWPGPFLLLIGPKNSGKSHLCQVWGEKSGAVTLNMTDLEELDINALTELSNQPLILEGVGTDVAEEKLFHLYNLVKEKQGHLLMTTQEPVGKWDLQLPDLKSRMGAVQVTNINEPDDFLFSSVMVKLFNDRQLQVSPDVIQYLLTRLERSFEKAYLIVDQLDQASLEEKRNITIPLVRELIEKEERQHGFWD